MIDIYHQASGGRTGRVNKTFLYSVVWTLREFGAYPALRNILSENSARLTTPAPIMVIFNMSL
jgi:hypothetical protein